MRMNEGGAGGPLRTEAGSHDLALAERLKRGNMQTRPQ